MHPENKKGHRPGQGSSGDKELTKAYPLAANLSRLQCLVVGLLAMTQSPYLDNNDRALAWAWLNRTLRRLVEVVAWNVREQFT